MKLSIWLVALIASSDAYRRVGKFNYRRNRPTRNRPSNGSGMIHLSDLLKSIENAQITMADQTLAIRKLAKMKQIVKTYE